MFTMVTRIAGILLISFSPCGQGDPSWCQLGSGAWVPMLWYQDGGGRRGWGREDLWPQGTQRQLLLKGCAVVRTLVQFCQLGSKAAEAMCVHGGGKGCWGPQWWGLLGSFGLPFLPRKKFAVRGSPLEPNCAGMGMGWCRKNTSYTFLSSSICVLHWVAIAL